MSACRALQSFQLDSQHGLDYLIFSMTNELMRSLRWDVLLLRSMANLESGSLLSKIRTLQGPTVLTQPLGSTGVHKEEEEAEH
jgi:hypothetical protein